jgi:hypothetical protein
MGSGHDDAPPFLNSAGDRLIATTDYATEYSDSRLRCGEEKPDKVREIFEPGATVLNTDFRMFARGSANVAM